MESRIHKAFPTDCNLPEQLAFIGLSFDKNGYKVRVSEFGKAGSPLLEIDFGKFPLAQRSMDEGKYLSTSWKADESEEKVGCIVVVEGSDFLEWFHKESCGIRSDASLFHVAILTNDEWIEVICDQLPTIRWLEV